MCRIKPFYMIILTLVAFVGAIVFTLLWLSPRELKVRLHSDGSISLNGRRVEGVEAIRLNFKKRVGEAQMPDCDRPTLSVRIDDDVTMKKLLIGLWSECAYNIMSSRMIIDVGEKKIALSGWPQNYSVDRINYMSMRCLSVSDGKTWKRFYDDGASADPYACGVPVCKTEDKLKSVVVVCSYGLQFKDIRPFLGVCADKGYDVVHMALMDFPPEQIPDFSPGTLFGDGINR